MFWVGIPVTDRFSEQTFQQCSSIAQPGDLSFQLVCQFVRHTAPAFFINRLIVALLTRSSRAASA
jgi:hypothetical protein